MTFVMRKVDVPTNLPSFVNMKSVEWFKKEKKKSFIDFTIYL